MRGLGFPPPPPPAPVFPGLSVTERCVRLTIAWNINGLAADRVDGVSRLEADDVWTNGKAQ